MSCREQGLDRVRNCDAVTNANIGWAFDPELRRCPVSQIDPAAVALLEAWRDWQSLGVLPYDGSIGEQPQFVLEAFAIFEAAAASRSGHGA